MIEYLDLERSHFGIISYLYLLQFTYEHDERILNKIQKPKLWEHNKHLILQMIVSNSRCLPNNFSKNKINSLLDVVNFTSTPAGKRLLKQRLKSIICPNN